MLGFGIVGLVLCHHGHPALKRLRDSRLVWLGTRSYGIYMYHYIVILLSNDIALGLGLKGRPFWREALTAAVIIALAALSWRYVEQPLLRLKDRFEYAPTPRAGLQSEHGARMNSR